MISWVTEYSRGGAVDMPSLKGLIPPKRVKSGAMYNKVM